VKNVGKPYAGKPHVRFDEEGLAVPALYFTILICNSAFLAEKPLQNLNKVLK
jgi:hypothetical protein